MSDAPIAAMIAAVRHEVQSRERAIGSRRLLSDLRAAQRVLEALAELLTPPSNHAWCWKCHADVGGEIRTTIAALLARAAGG